MYCYRSGADTDQIGICADNVPYAHRLLESHCVDGDRDGSPFRVRMREDPAGNIHLAQEPAPEDVTILRRCHHSDWYRPACKACVLTAFPWVRARRQKLLVQACLAPHLVHSLNNYSRAPKRYPRVPTLHGNRSAPRRFRRLPQSSSGGA